MKTFHLTPLIIIINVIGEYKLLIFKSKALMAQIEVLVYQVLILVLVSNYHYMLMYENHFQRETSKIREKCKVDLKRNYHIKQQFLPILGHIRAIFRIYF